MSSKVIAEVISGSRGIFGDQFLTRNASLSVSGSIGALDDPSERGISVFGGDAFISGTLHVSRSLILGHTSQPALLQTFDGQNALLVDGDNFLDLKADVSSRMYITGINGSNREALTLFQLQGVIINADDEPDMSFRVATGGSNPKTHALYVDAGTDQVLIHSGGAATSPLGYGTDTSFFISGTLGDPHAGSSARSGRPNEGLSVYGGDLFSSGTVYTNTVRSAEESLILRGMDSGKGISINSTGILATAGNLFQVSAISGDIHLGAQSSIRLHTHGAGGTIQIGPKVVPSPTEMVLILSGGGQASPNMANAGDTCFFVSGSIGSRKTSVAGTAAFGGDIFVSGTLESSGSLKRGRWTDGYIGNDEFIAVMPSEFNSFPVSGSSIGGNNYPGPYQFGTITRFTATPSSGSFVEFPYRNNNASATFAYAQKMIPLGFEATGIRINSLNNSLAVVAFSGRIDDGTTNTNKTGFGRPTNADRNFGITGNIVGDGAAYVTLGIKLTHFPSAATSPGPIFGAKIYIRRTAKE